MKVLLGFIVAIAALVLGVVWFATKGRGESDDDNNPDNWGGW